MGDKQVPDVIRDHLEDVIKSIGNNEGRYLHRPTMDSTLGLLSRRGYNVTPLKKYYFAALNYLREHKEGEPYEFN